MTQDEIIEMAIQAELNLYVHDLTEKQYIQVIETFAKLVEDAAFKRWAAQTKLAVQDEREACAAICDAEQKKNEGKGQWMWEAKKCGIAIRARGEA
jgi:hypothetical protein